MKKIIFIISLILTSVFGFANNNTTENENVIVSNSSIDYPTITGWCGSNAGTDYNFTGSLIDISSKATSANIVIFTPKFSSWTVRTSPNESYLIAESAASGNIDILSTDGEYLAGKTIDIEGYCPEVGKTITLHLSLRARDY